MNLGQKFLQYSFSCRTMCKHSFMCSGIIISVKRKSKVLNNMPYFVYVVIMSRMAVFYFIITFHIFSRFPLL